MELINIGRMAAAYCRYSLVVQTKNEILYGCLCIALCRSYRVRVDLCHCYMCSYVEMKMMVRVIGNEWRDSLNARYMPWSDFAWGKMTNAIFRRTFSFFEINLLSRSFHARKLTFLLTQIDRTVQIASMPPITSPKVDDRQSFVHLPYLEWHFKCAPSYRLMRI